jgi:hypothetical protein
MPNLPSCLPARIVAGDTLAFTRTFADYLSSDGWLLKYTFISGAAVSGFDATAQPDGSFLVNVEGSVTVDWPVGQFKLVEYVVKDTQRFTLNSEPFTVVANLAGSATPIETRSHARKMLDLIEAYFEKKLPNAHTVMLDGLRIDSHPIPDLIALRDKYAIMVQREELRASGKSSPKIRVSL